MPELQLRLVLGFALAVMMGLGLQGLLLVSRMSDLVGSLSPQAALEVSPLLRPILTRVVLESAFILMPLVLGFGVLLTFRIAGPLYRIERFLEGVRDGSETEPCRLRSGDELNGLCELVNDVTEARRSESREPESVAETRVAA